MLCKELIYVAETRERKKQIDIGSISAFVDGIKVSENAIRNTWEKDLIKKWEDNKEAC
jgi:ATP-dependent exoDNAse (exonuclease V) alpha subunit